MKTDAISGTPPMEKLVAVDSQATKYFEVPEQKVSFNLQKHSVGAERAVSRSLNIWSSMDLNPITRASPNVNLSCDKNTTSTHFENGLFSSSMSELFSRKCK